MFLNISCNISLRSSLLFILHLISLSQVAALELTAASSEHTKVTNVEFWKFFTFSRRKNTSKFNQSRKL